jgi:hypothetical protein
MAETLYKSTGASANGEPSPDGAAAHDGASANAGAQHDDVIDAEFKEAK